MDNVLTIYWPAAVGVLAGIEHQTFRLSERCYEPSQLTLRLGRVAVLAVPFLWVLLTRWTDGTTGVALVAVFMVLGAGVMCGILLGSIVAAVLRRARRLHD